MTNDTLKLPADATPVPLRTVAVHLHPQDNVAIAKTRLEPGTVLAVELSDMPLAHVRIRQAIPSAHKLALRSIHEREPVQRYGQTIGFATQPIQPGDHVHSHNMDAQDFDRDYAFGADVHAVEIVPEPDRRTFLGYSRPNGRVGTRNYIAVISTANCSAHATREIARHFTPERLAGYGNVDGVIALYHGYGCSTSLGGADYALLQRTLAGMATHPNVAAYVLVGLGCEVNQADALVEGYQLCGHNPFLAECPPILTIQDLGGIRKTINAGIATIEDLLPQVDQVSRTPQPVSELVLALQCGGSDGWSGITANPVVGLVADEIVRQGGTVVLSETTEIYGAEHLLTRRAINPEVGRKLLTMVQWWEDYTRKMGIKIDNNPTPGNKAGGLTSIYEKSLGAVAKGGRTPLTGVYEYAEPVTSRGLAFMNGPGNDWTSVTGQVAGGCTLVLFTTGRGSVFGFKPAPVIKIVSNSATYQHLQDDMDLNTGRVLEGVDGAVIAAELLELVVAVASGQPTKSEGQGVGEAEFVPWHLGETL
jgi:altronate hydrolase